MEVLVRGLGELAPRDDQRARAFACHVGRLLFELVVALHDLRHDDVRAFSQERVLTRDGIAHDDAHTLGFGCKGEDLEDIVGDCGTGWCAEFNACAVAERMRQTN